MNLIILIVVVAAIVIVLRWLRPKLREQRHRRWEEAGLLPHQVDPYAPRDSDGHKGSHQDDRPHHPRG